MTENFESKQQNKQDMQDAGAKTAHVAGKVAASYFGGTLGNVAYDKIFQTKLGQKIEQGAGKVISRVPGVNKLNKKLNDTGAVDAADKAVDLVGGKGAAKAGKSVNSLPKSGIGAASKTTKPLGRGGRKTTGDGSTPKALENRKKGGYAKDFLSRNKTNSTSSTTSTEETSSDTNNEEEENETNELGESKDIFSFGFSKYKLKILLIFGCGGFILLLLLVLMVTTSMFATTDTSLAPISSINSDETQNHYYDNEKYPELYEQEIKFNNSIGNKESSSGIIGEYQDKYGVTLDVYMLEATLLYRDYAYYLVRLDNMSEEEYKKLTESDPGYHQKIYNFEEAAKYINTVAELMISSTGEGEYVNYYTDITKNGEYYNKLLNSSFFTEYYSKVLAYEKYSDQTKLVDEIFDYAEFMRYAVEGEKVSSYIISDSMKVHLQTCAKYKYKIINNISIYDNPAATNNEAEAPSIVSLVDYGVGVLYGELSSYTKSYANGQGDNMKEGLKALLVASYSFMLGQRSYGHTGLDLKQPDLYYPTGNCRMVCCNPNTNSHYAKYNGDKHGTCMSTTSSSANHPALSQDQLTKLRELVSEVFGEVMVEKGVTTSTFSGYKDIKYGNYYDSINNSDCGANCLGQEEAIQDSKNGMTYREILAKYYDSTKYDIINIKEGLYVENANYSNASYDGNVIFYDQGDYSKVNFCGQSNKHISSSGCGVTSMAIVASSFTGNKTYDPVYMMNLAYSMGDCGSGIRGTNASFFKKAAQKLGFGYKYIGKKNASQVVDVLKTGKSMVIAHMDKGHFTDNGHYIVLTAVNENGKVYVHDPNNRGNSKNKKTGNGWYDLDMIAGELKSGFYVITKG